MNKKIHNLLKIQNDNTTIFTNKELKMIDDYINELEAYKYNLDRDYLRLEKENKKLNEELDKLNHIIDKQDRDIVILSKGNKELKEVIEKAIKYISNNYIEVLKYHDIPSETTSYEIVTVDLLKILKGGENE